MIFITFRGNKYYLDDTDVLLGAYLITLLVIWIMKHRKKKGKQNPRTISE